MSARSAIRSVTFTLIVLACAAYMAFLRHEKPRAPAVVSVSACGELEPGMRRIGDYGFQFDIPVLDFSIREGWGDEPPVPHGYILTEKDSKSELAISWHSQMMGVGAPPEIPELTSNGYVERRRVLDDKGRVIGEDDWGYWDAERWRRVHLLGWIVASYGSRDKSELASHGSVHDKEAALFDASISSVCRVSGPEAQSLKPEASHLPR